MQHFSQWEVADQLGISTRQVRREQHNALEVLASQLWEQYDIAGKVEPDRPPRRGEGSHQDAAGDAPLYEDLLWLRETPPEASVDPQQELRAVLELAQPLAAQRGVSLEIVQDAVLPSWPAIRWPSGRACLAFSALRSRVRRRRNLWV